MASADPREERKCSICLTLSAEPASLSCGHNFCRECVAAVLDTQEKLGVYSCPQCRAAYPECPLLEQDRKPCNVVEGSRSTQLKQEKTDVPCTYSVDHPIAAVQTCLQCETSMCDKHLMAHKSADHVLAEPNASYADTKCSIHKEILKYYCTEDGACVCTTCTEAGDHKGHQLELLNEAYEKKKQKVKSATKKVNSKKQELERRIQDLKNQRSEEKEKATAVTGEVTGLFRDIRQQVDVLEKKVMAEISKQENQVFQSICNLIQQLENQKDELTRRITQMEDLCKITDPFHLLKKDFSCDNISSKSGDDISEMKDAGLLDEVLISLMLRRSLHHFTDNLLNPKDKRQYSGIEKSDISLDMKTANNYINISQDLRSATYTEKPKTRQDGPKRFKSKQVLSTQSFSSGRHYWEVDVSGAEKWLIGVAATSIKRKIDGNESFIGYNDKSWGLTQRISLQAGHNNILNKIDLKSSLKAVGIYLDYEAGHLSFYKLCEPMKHLQTFTASFTEPLHAAFFLFKDSTIRIIQ